MLNVVKSKRAERLEKALVEQVAESRNILTRELEASQQVGSSFDHK